jgi:hypothetical protein
MQYVTDVKQILKGWNNLENSSSTNQCDNNMTNHTLWTIIKCAEAHKIVAHLESHSRTPSGKC